MTRQASAAQALHMKLISAAVASCFAAGAYANPTGAVVVNGAVSMATPAPGVLQITNSPNSIINWQGFSIAPGELTQFIQQSTASAVLNRVVTSSPSDIFGTLQSNGRVFLINPNGILFGAGATVDVAGLVASTLNLTDADFLDGRMRFQEVPGAGQVANYGSLFTPQGGQIYLVGPAVTNGGVITSPQGEVVLAAGNSVELMHTGTPGLSVSITAPGNQAMNLGQIFADSGRVGIFAGLINQDGMVSAGTAVFGEDGSIKLVATDSTTFAAGSNTFATGPLNIETGDLTVAGFVQSGPQTISATGALTVRGDAASSGQLSAFGGQTINARAIDVVAQDGGSAFIMNSGSGDQVIAVAGGGSSAGLDVRTLSGGSVASISNNAFGATQSIIVTDADHISVNGMGTGGASIFAIPGSQFVSITGTGANAINIGSAGAQGFSNVGASNQWMTAGAPGESGSITIVGSDGNQRLAGLVSQPGVGNAQTVSTSGTLSITGGGAPAQLTNFPAGIFHNGTGQQFISAQDIVLQGGGIGTNNSVQIGANNGTQLVNAGGISLIGGPAGTGNSAQLRANQGQQTIFADQVSLAAGAGGTNNFAIITAPGQSITVSGDLTITGGGSLGTPGVGGGARIGGRGGAAATPTDLALAVGGNVTLNGGTVAGAGAAIGSSTAGGQPTTITMNVGGDVTLNPGAVADAGTRIGSPAAGVAGGEIVVDADGTIALNSAGPGNAGAIRTADGVTLRASGITQGPDALIQANTLTIETQQGASLVGINSVNAFNAVNAWFGDVSLHNSSPLLTVTGVQNFGGAFALQQTGDALVNGLVFSGPQTVDVSGGLTLQSEPGSFASLSASGGQTVNASHVSINGANGQAGILNFGGDQAVSANSILLQGGASGSANSALIIAGNGSQFVNAGSITLIGGADGSGNFAHINALNGNQTVNAGSISLAGGAGGISNSALLRAGSNQAISTESILLQGGSLGNGNSAAIVANSGLQTINAGGVALIGGADGSGNFAHINAINGTQAVDAGSISLTGGSGGTNNTALLRAGGGLQTVVADQMTVNAGAGGTGNFAVVVAPQQDVTVHGDLTLNGGGSAPTPTAGGAALIGGGNNFPTNLALTVGGNVTLNGGHVVNSGATLGSGLTGLQRTDITMNVGGNVTLNPGTATGSRIGSGPGNLAGGEIVVNAGGTIALNSAGPGLAGAIRTADGVTLRAQSITQGPHALIKANALTVETQHGASLIGANAVNSLSAVNTTSGAFAFNNASPLLTVTGIDQVSDGALSLGQSGNLLIGGNVTSGAQTIGATGDFTITPGDGPGVTVQANGAQTFSAGGSFSLLGGTALDGYAQSIASGPLQVSTGGNLMVQGGSGYSAYSLLYGGEEVRLTVGNELHVNGGASPFAFGRIQTGFWDTIYLTFPNRESGGYFVDGREGVTHQGLDGFFTGLRPAVHGLGLIVHYGE